MGNTPPRVVLERQYAFSPTCFQPTHRFREPVIACGRLEPPLSQCLLLASWVSTLLLTNIQLQMCLSHVPTFLFPSPVIVAAADQMSIRRVSAQQMLSDIQHKRKSWQMIKCSSISSLLLTDNWQTEHQWWQSPSEFKGRKRAAIQQNSCNKKINTPNPQQIPCTLTPELRKPQPQSHSLRAGWTPRACSDPLCEPFDTTLGFPYIFSDTWTFTVSFGLGHGQESTWNILWAFPSPHSQILTTLPCPFPFHFTCLCPSHPTIKEHIL